MVLIVIIEFYSSPSYNMLILIFVCVVDNSVLFALCAVGISSPFRYSCSVLQLSSYSCRHKSPCESHHVEPFRRPLESGTLAHCLPLRRHAVELVSRAFTIIFAPDDLLACVLTEHRAVDFMLITNPFSAPLSQQQNIFNPFSKIRLPLTAALDL